MGVTILGNAAQKYFVNDSNLYFVFRYYGPKVVLPEVYTVKYRHNHIRQTQ